MTLRQYELGGAELDVVKVLWDNGPATVRDVMTHLHNRGRRLAYTTVQTLLNRMEQKKFVSSNKSDLAYVYKAKVSRERVTKSRLDRLLNQMYDGAAGPLVLQLVKSEKLSQDEIEQLHKLVDELDSSGS